MAKFASKTEIDNERPCDRAAARIKLSPPPPFLFPAGDGFEIDQARLDLRYTKAIHLFFTLSVFFFFFFLFFPFLASRRDRWRNELWV